MLCNENIWNAKLDCFFNFFEDLHWNFDGNLIESVDSLPPLSQDGHFQNTHPTSSWALEIILGSSPIPVFKVLKILLYKPFICLVRVILSVSLLFHLLFLFSFWVYRECQFSYISLSVCFSFVCRDATDLYVWILYPATSLEAFFLSTLGVF